LTRRYFHDALIAHGVCAETVPSGAAALAAIGRAAFELVIADLRMPGPAGIELLDAIRTAQSAALPAVVAVSGELLAAERARLISAGFLDALQKPVSRADLLGLIDRVSLGVAADSGPALNGADNPPAASAPDAPPREPESDLDDEAALRALGTRATVSAMRALLRQDLPGQCRSLQREIESGHSSAAAELLHRLRAACGMCGLPRLGSLSLQLERAVQSSAAEAGRLHHQWQLAASDALAALNAAPSGGAGGISSESFATR
jgi:CheY-like chemotaxis protein